MPDKKEMDMSTGSDETKLLRKCLQGDSKSFEVIVGKYQGLVCAITYGGLADLGRSEEVAQQTFINVWSRLSQLNDLSKFRPWLCSIARNHVKSFIKENKRDILQKAKPMENVNEKTADESGPLESAIKKEHIELVDAALGQIPEQYRETLVMYYRHHQSVKQVAGSLDLSEEVVKKRLQRGREKIKEQLGSIVEETLSATGPKKAFTGLVMGSIAGIAIKGTATTAVAAGVSSTTITATTLMGTITAKIITAAVAAAIGVGSVLVYKQVTKQGMPGATLQTEKNTAVQQQKAEDDKPAVQRTIISNEDIKKEADVSSAVLDEGEGVDGQPVEQPENSVVSAITSEYIFKPKGVLSGRITDIETGEPVTPADISIRKIGSRTFESVTDPNGFYYFEKIEDNGEYRIGIESKEYVGIADWQARPIVFLKEGTQTTKHFQLQKACMIDIDVVDEEGKAVKGAFVHVTSPASDRANDIFEARTDIEGYCLLGGIPPAETEYLITVMHRDKSKKIQLSDGSYRSESSLDFAPGKLIVKLTDPDVIEYGKVVMKKGIKVKGYAEYSDGVVAEGVEIIAKPDWWHCNSGIPGARVDSDGFFVLEHIEPGNHSIHSFFRNLDGGGGYSFTVTESKLPLEGDELLVVNIPKKSPGSLVSISGSIIIEGDGRPGHIDVSAYCPTGSRGRADIGRDMDTFKIDSLEPGNYRVTFRGGNIQEKVLEGIEAPSEGLVVELEYFEKPKIAGVVIDKKSGTAVSDFKARVKKIRTLGAGYSPGDQWIDYTDKEGRFEMEMVGPGVYQVQIAAEGYAWCWSKEFSTDDNELIEISLTPGGKIAGMVVDSSGKPITGAKVLPLSMAGGNRSRTFNMFISESGMTKTVKGEFLLENLAEGDETLKVTCDGYNFSVVGDIKVVEGETTENVKIVLNKGGTVEGYVYDHLGNVQSDVILYFQGASGYSGGSDEDVAGRFAIAISDPNGFYRAEGLPEEMCYIRRKNSGSLRGVVRRTVLPQIGKVSRVDFGGEPTVSGRLVLKGELVADRKVVFSSVISPRSGMFVCYSRTNEDGEFDFNGVPDGKFAVYYAEEGKRSEWIKAATVDVRGEDIDIGTIPEGTAKVFVTVDKQGTDGTMPNIHLGLRKGVRDQMAQPVGNVKPPTREGDPYVIENVPAGKYTIVITTVSYNNMTFTKVIEVKDEEDETEVKFTIPISTASITGKITGDVRAIQLWSSDEGLSGYVMLDSEGAFKVDNLPAGKYYMGTNSSLGKDVIGEFVLSDGQEGFVEFDASDLKAQIRGMLQVNVVDENGIPCGGADAWLEKGDQKVEPYMNNEGNIYFITEPGRYSLVITSSDHKGIGQMVEIKQADKNSHKPQTKVIRLEKK